MDVNDGVSPRLVPSSDSKPMYGGHEARLRYSIEQSAEALRQIEATHLQELSELTSEHYHAVYRVENVKVKCNDYIDRSASQLVDAAMEASRQTLTPAELAAGQVAETQYRLQLEKEHIENLEQEIQKELRSMKELKAMIDHRIEDAVALKDRTSESVVRKRTTLRAQYSLDNGPFLFFYSVLFLPPQDNVSPEELEVLRQRQQALDHIAAASKGSASVLAATWNSELAQLKNAVDGQYAVRVRSMKPVKEQLAKYTDTARARARRVAGKIADEAGLAYDRHLARAVKDIATIQKGSRSRDQGPLGPAASSSVEAADGGTNATDGAPAPDREAADASLIVAHLTGREVMSAGSATSLRREALESWAGMPGHSSAAEEAMLKAIVASSVACMPAEKLLRARALADAEADRLAAVVTARTLVATIESHRARLEQGEGQDAGVQGSARTAAPSADSIAAAAALSKSAQYLRDVSRMYQQVFGRGLDSSVAGVEEAARISFD